MRCAEGHRSTLLGRTRTVVTSRIARPAHDGSAYPSDLAATLGLTRDSRTDRAAHDRVFVLRARRPRVGRVDPALLSSGQADPSTVGIVLASVSFAIIPFLSYAQRQTGRVLGSLSAVADSKSTLLCTHLSAVLLFGLVRNSTLEWGWADPIAGLVIAAIAIKEGRNAWRVIPAARGRDPPLTINGSSEARHRT